MNCKCGRCMKGYKLHCTDKHAALRCFVISCLKFSLVINLVCVCDSCLDSCTRSEGHCSRKEESFHDSFTHTHRERTEVRCCMLFYRSAVFYSCTHVTVINTEAGCFKLAVAVGSIASRWQHTAKLRVQAPLYSSSTP